MAENNPQQNSSPKLIARRQSLLPHFEPGEEPNQIMATREKKAHTFYPHMFIEDAVQRIFPYTDRRNQSCTVDVEPTDSHALDIYIKAFRPSENMPFTRLRESNSPHVLKEGMSKFLRACVHQLLTYQLAVYEIFDLEDSATGKSVGFRLASINPSSVHIGRRKVVQFFSPSDAEYLNDSAKRLKGNKIVIRAQNLLIVKLPEPLRFSYGHMIDELVQLGSISANMHELSQKAQQANIPIDYSHLSSETLRLLFRITQAVGWDGRSTYYSEKNMLEFYWYERRLQFVEFIIDLRNHILDTLNNQLARHAKRFEVSSKIVINGLPDKATIAKVKADLHNGSTQFSEVFSLIYDT